MIVRRSAGEGPYRCPCCGFITLGERAAFEICDVCYWEDDGQDEHDADEVRGGPNHDLSLRQAGAGACVPQPQVPKSPKARWSSQPFMPPLRCLP
ncbi:CPCC family cysteine-rich protein [Streptomyces sp. NPDC003006]